MKVSTTNPFHTQKHRWSRGTAFHVMMVPTVLRACAPAPINNLDDAKNTWKMELQRTIRVLAHTFIRSFVKWTRLLLNRPRPPRPPPPPPHHHHHRQAPDRTLVPLLIWGQ